MKKTFSKIVACFFVIGVLFVSTPFLINTKADTINNYQLINSYKTGNLTLNDGYIKFQFFEYYDFENQVLRIKARVLSDSAYSEDYSNINLILYRYTSSELIWDYANRVSFNDYVYSSGQDFFDLDIYYSSSIDHLFKFQFIYDLTEDDNDIHYNETFNLGFPVNLIIGSDYGYSLGYQDGQTDTITNTDPTTIISRFGQGINSILSIPIFGQLTLGTLIFIPLSMAVLLLLLKIWRRN